MFKHNLFRKAVSLILVLAIAAFAAGAALGEPVRVAVVQP